MRKTKKIFWGLFFIVAAVWVIFGRSLPFFKEIGVFSLIFAALCIASLIDGIRKLDWGEILFPLAFLAIIFDDVLHITEYTPWPVIGAAVLGTIGLNILFGHKGKNHFGVYHNGRKLEKNEIVDEEISEDEYYKAEIAFATTVKYVTSQNLKKADIENSFGTLTVYFDNATIGGNAMINVDNSFGKTILYIPKEWNTYVTTDSSFGNVETDGQPIASSECMVQINADTSFGNIQIIYV